MGPDFKLRNNKKKTKSNFLINSQNEMRIEDEEPTEHLKPPTVQILKKNMSSKPELLTSKQSKAEIRIAFRKKQ